MSMEIMLRYIVGIAIAYGIGKWIYQSIRSRSIDYFLLAIIALMGAVLWLSRGFLISNRVYDFLTKEIEFQTLEIELCEKRIKEYSADKEEKEAEVTKNDQILNERLKDLEQKKSELDEIISETKQEEEKLRDKAKDLETKIEPRLLQSFKRIRKNSRNGLGIVYVQRDACGGCFNKIPPQRQLDIRSRKKVIVCEYCGRIMIDPELAGVQIEHKVEEAPATTTKRAIRRKTAE